MKRVDQMIRYVSGECSPEEAQEWESILDADPVLREEQEDLVLLYDHIGHKLRDEDEARFINKLQEIMERSEVRGGFFPMEKGQRSRERKGIRKGILLAASMAASIAVVFMIFFTGNREVDLFLSYYHPEEDPALLALQEETRSPSQSLARMYAQGEYEDIMTQVVEMKGITTRNETDLLFCLLASLELGRETEVLDVLKHHPADPLHPASPALNWYTALAHLKNGQEEEASRLLQALAKEPGSYRRSAHKLVRLLTK